MVVTVLCAGAMAATALSWILSGDPAVIVLVELAGLTGVALVSTTVVRRELRPLERAADTADTIAAGDFAQRLTVAASAPTTEVGRLADALNGMLDQIQAALTAREQSEERMRQFVADASHELRTPLQSLRGYAELYQSGALPDRAAVNEAVERMLSEIHRMTRLVESLLGLARFDEQDEASLEPVDLSGLVRDCCRDARAVEPSRPTGAYIEPDVTVSGDEAQLRSLLSNLLGNVRMHTAPDVPCRVTLSTSGDEVMLRVEDFGPGIPHESLTHVFDRFYRADKGRSRVDGGSGLGLAIVAAITDLHHGRIRLDSVPGRGTRVDVLLPASRTGSVSVDRDTLPRSSADRAEC
ncbi:HAMP domain-containing protein [Streptomyces sp. LBUM 1478]|nr:periplasmic sensor signal transduction histidine kinase [Streptomyces turgidiscabies Car8]KFG10532.1 histidine kinase [Streptomyces scabiei]KND42043.1 histidine kinase [Streptomyces stelliscabiei]MBP5865035.1 HAMP domain-containing protein [Streptomyces sp. LBUM 1484]MBP5872918.1 HAMP domain-containing protein [Streptomyces sp. LBUM 1485]MBP5874286.1 HAMP domain-containing protein [Streptomyces sp. LBUM 1477]MBP5882022.1 HAMP domain-containing protein [Streptomyces sp. LBUM 1487]MBP589509